uniref:Secreted protein n=1 Tax=Ditylenchus dipsaci TaxID=166011 RepID=A0A915DW17_9BILA
MGIKQVQFIHFFLLLICFIEASNSRRSDDTVLKKAISNASFIKSALLKEESEMHASDKFSSNKDDKIVQINEELKKAAKHLREFFPGTKLKIEESDETDTYVLPDYEVPQGATWSEAKDKVTKLIKLAQSFQDNVSVDKEKLNIKWDQLQLHDNKAIRKLFAKQTNKTEEVQKAIAVLKQILNTAKTVYQQQIASVNQKPNNHQYHYNRVDYNQEDLKNSVLPSLKYVEQQLQEKLTQLNSFQLNFGSDTSKTYTKAHHKYFQTLDENFDGKLTFDKNNLQTDDVKVKIDDVISLADALQQHINIYGKQGSQLEKALEIVKALYHKAFTIYEEVDEYAEKYKNLYTNEARSWQYILDYNLPKLATSENNLKQKLIDLIDFQLIRGSSHSTNRFFDHYGHLEVDHPKHVHLNSSNAKEAMGTLTTTILSFMAAVSTTHDTFKVDWDRLEEHTEGEMAVRKLFGAYKHSETKDLDKAIQIAAELYKEAKAMYEKGQAQMQKHKNSYINEARAWQYIKDYSMPTLLNVEAQLRHRLEQLIVFKESTKDVYTSEKMNEHYGDHEQIDNSLEDLTIQDNLKEKIDLFRDAINTFVKNVTIQGNHLTINYDQFEEHDPADIEVRKWFAQKVGGEKALDKAIRIASNKYKKAKRVYEKYEPTAQKQSSVYDNNYGKWLQILQNTLPTLYRAEKNLRLKLKELVAFKDTNQEYSSDHMHEHYGDHDVDTSLENETNPKHLSEKLNFFNKAIAKFLEAVNIQNNHLVVQWDAFEEHDTASETVGKWFAQQSATRNTIDKLGKVSEQMLKLLRNEKELRALLKKLIAFEKLHKNSEENSGEQADHSHYTSWHGVAQQLNDTYIQNLTDVNQVKQNLGNLMADLRAFSSAVEVQPGTHPEVHLNTQNAKSLFEKYSQSSSAVNQAFDVGLHLYNQAKLVYEKLSAQVEFYKSSYSQQARIWQEMTYSNLPLLLQEEKGLRHKLKLIQRVKYAHNHHKQKEDALKAVDELSQIFHAIQAFMSSIKNEGANQAAHIVKKYKSLEGLHSSSHQEINDWIKKLEGDELKELKNKQTELTELLVKSSNKSKIVEEASSQEEDSGEKNYGIRGVIKQVTTEIDDDETYLNTAHGNNNASLEKAIEDGEQLIRMAKYLYRTYNKFALRKRNQQIKNLINKLRYENVPKLKAKLKSLKAPKKSQIIKQKSSQVQSHSVENIEDGKHDHGHSSSSVDPKVNETSVAAEFLHLTNLVGGFMKRVSIKGNRLSLKHGHLQNAAIKKDLTDMFGQNGSEQSNADKAIQAGNQIYQKIMDLSEKCNKSAKEYGNGWWKTKFMEFITKLREYAASVIAKIKKLQDYKTMYQQSNNGKLKVD